MVTKPKKRELGASFDQIQSSIIDGGTTVTKQDMHKSQLVVTQAARRLGYSNAEAKRLLAVLGIAEKVVLDDEADAGGEGPELAAPDRHHDGEDRQRDGGEL